MGAGDGDAIPALVAINQARSDQNPPAAAEETGYRHRLAAVCLALGVGAKLYPIVLAANVIAAVLLLMLIGFAAMLISGLIGTTLGVMAGYFGGLIDGILFRRLLRKPTPDDYTVAFIVTSE